MLAESSQEPVRGLSSLGVCQNMVEKPWLTGSLAIKVLKTQQPGFLAIHM
jgi:hypothetical protein